MNGNASESGDRLGASGADSVSASAPASGELILREVTLADLDVLATMEAALFAGEAWSRELVREEITGKHRRYLVLEDASTGQIAGYAGLLAVGTEGDVQTIAVAPEYRGQGAGRRLMHALLSAAREAGVRELFLEVRADNPVARALYISLGFEEIGLRRGYYQPGDIDAVVMRLSPVPPLDGDPAHAHTEGEGR